MIDTLFAKLPAAQNLCLPGQLGFQRGQYALATLHRPSNVDGLESLRAVLEALAHVTREMPVALPLHPRTRKRIQQFGLEDWLAKLRVLEPLGYIEMLSLIDGAAVVLTDSGGLQEETTALGVPCVTLRQQTERPITIMEGTNRLAPWPLSAAGIWQSCIEALQQGRREAGTHCPEGWDGHAAERIVHFLQVIHTST
jgi:UDP-N-acetylglucosamine 2-epimerase (non-hydrolysing)